MKEILYQVTLPYACAGIIVRNKRVVEAAPIFGWMRGRTVSEVSSWVRGKRGKFEVL